MKRLLFVIFGVLLLIPFVCTGGVQAIHDTVGGGVVNPITSVRGNWAGVLGRGVGVLTINGQNTEFTWTAYSQREGSDIIWMISVPLPSEYAEQVGRTVDPDNTVERHWRVTASKDGKQTAVHTSYDWVSRYCSDNREPGNNHCYAQRVLEAPLKQFRSFEFVKLWEVKQYLPKPQ